MKSNESARVIYYRNSLHYLLNSGGGITREKAISEASKNVEGLAGELLPVLNDEISKLEEALSSAPETLSETFIREVFQRQGVIYNLAGTFGCSGLRQIAKSLGDLLADMIELGVRPIEPIQVHVRAARIFRPGMPPVHEEAQKLLINHLASVRQFLRSEAEGRPLL
ncbi:hypothetical protein [Parvibaculum sp.]|jgi:hypothetical protein|uniref:hypothetical protein n=1 Tax=Parvibaculum sp. TaxID=2024848 RepID=UPI00391D9AAF